MFSLNKKLTILIWSAIGGLILTSVFTTVLFFQASRMAKKINYIYKQSKHI
jgi:hypothetical protein